MAPPGVAAPTSTTSSGGNASSLFPTVAPGSAQAEGASPVANVSALSGGTPIGSEVAEGAGLAALGVAMILAITRLSLAPPHAPARGELHGRRGSSPARSTSRASGERGLTDLSGC